MIQSLERILEVFELLRDWEDRYNYIAELGQKLPALPDTDKTAEQQVQGCVSKVWITVEVDDIRSQLLTFRGDSDTPIIKGIIAILIAVYSGKTAGEVLATDADAIFNKLGIYDHLSPTRHVGVYAMVDKFHSLVMPFVKRVA